MKDIVIVTTSDGSHSLHSSELDEGYHSKHGAIQEAKHVFIQNGLAYFIQKELSVLEVGFGTGLNALLALDFAVTNKIKISYSGLETKLLEYSLVEKMNYLEQLKLFEYNDFFKKMHTEKEGEEVELSSYLKFKKHNMKVQDFVTNEKFDIVFYDAFSPTSQLEMWEVSIFEKLFSQIKSGGVLVTYCAKGQLKRDLKSCGFRVESLPGPPGKREMVRAVKL
jgi:tRNA U34 5-methylaminomethyl-2-thiouridine-forming methyltransferase MnmC